MSSLPASSSALPASKAAPQTGRALMALRQMLLRGEFRPGERISELPLVTQLGVSRTPLRLALDRLAHEGLVEASPSGGFLVRQFTPADIWDAIALRGSLEGIAARMVAERLTDVRELDALQTYQAEMETLGTSSPEQFSDYLDLNHALHTGLVELARSPILARTIDQVVALPFASPGALIYIGTQSPTALKLRTIAIEQHRAILEAIGNREGSRAEALVREHSQLARRNLEFALAHQNLWNSVPGASLIKLPVRS